VGTPATTEHYLCARPHDAATGFRQQALSMYRTLFAEIEARGARPSEIVAERVFLSDVRAQSLPLLQIRAEIAGLDGESGPPPTTPIQQPPALPGRLCEVQAFVVSPIPGKRFTSRIISDLPPYASGRMIETDGARQLFLSNITGGVDGEDLDARGQTDSMFRVAEALLKNEGMSFHDVVRTWICLADIDRDYAALNASRRTFFISRNIAPPPASTGIFGPPYPRGKVICLDLRAIDGKRRPQIQPIHSPTLNEAMDYGSDFSRGLRLDYRDRRVIHLSGTASIDTRGEVVHPGRIDGQVDRMLVNVEELFAGQGAGYENLVSAITYLKRPEFLEVFLQVAARRGLTQRVPNTICVADVCRPEWLCEIEAIAVLS
jgi:enamine deaminase RidA (YjgF/YER057c/UK114 family)